MSDYKTPRPLPTDSAADPCVVYDNAVSFDGVINGDTTVTTYTGKKILSLSQAIDLFGFGEATFTFATGGTLESKKLLVSNSPIDGFLYKYVGAGSAPIVVTAGTDPTIGGNWQAFAATTLQALSGLTEPSGLDSIYDRQFDTVTEMLSFNGLILGQKVKTYAYNAPTINAWEIVSAGAGDMTDRTLLLSNGLFAKLTSGIHNVLSYGAFGNDIDDDKPFFDIAKIGSGGALIVPVPLVRYNLSNGLDWSGTTVQGGSKLHCKLRFSPAQTDCIISSGDTVLRDMHIDGRWDGATSSQTGDLIRVSSASFIAEFHAYSLTLVNAKQDSISMSNLGYSSLEDIQSQVTGRIGLHLDGSSSRTNTSLRLNGSNRFSDCPNGFGIRVYDAHNCNFSGAICEFTAGIEIAGNDNRCLVFDNVYQEFGSFPAAYTFTGAGDGLTITNNFGGGKILPNTGNFINVTMFGNSNFSSIAPIQANDLITVTSSQATTPAVTGRTSATILQTPQQVPSGLWVVEAVVQTEDAGSSSLVSLASLVTVNNADTAYQLSTSNLVQLTDSVMNNPSPSTRMKISGYLSLGSASTVYLRLGHDQSAGQIAYSGAIRMYRVK